MNQLVEQFCTAFEAWDKRSGIGDVYLGVVMRWLGGSVPRAAPEMAESHMPESSRIPLLEPADTEELYTVDELRRTLEFLVRHVGINAGFLISSLIRAVDSELEQSAEAYAKGLEKLPSSSEVQRMIEHYSGKGTLPPNAERALTDMADFLQEKLSALPRQGQGQPPLAIWRELMTPILDADIMKAELYGEFDEEEF